MLPHGWQATGLQLESGQAWLHQVRRGDNSEELFALKRLKDPKRAARFAREARTMRALRERGVSVPEIVDLDLDADRPWFAMRWFPDGSLQKAVEDGRFVTDRIAGLQTLDRLASTLSDVHAAEVAHRDLKPANVLVDGKLLLLTDFGLCLELDGDADAERLTETWEAIGSRHYIAPENEGGLNAALDQRPADFYAFGKLARALLAGSTPLPREADLEDQNLLSRVLGDQQLSPIDELLRDLLNRDPRARLADWDVVRDELQAVESAIGGRQRGAPRPVGADLLRIARRVRTADKLTSQLEQTAIEQRRQAWYGELVTALTRRASDIAPALESLQAELTGLIEFYATSGGAIAPEQLAAAGASELPAAVPESLGPSGTVAAAYLIHSPRGVPGLPSLTIRVWPISDGGQVWFVRAPTLASAGEPETVPEFLLGSTFRLVGPFPANRQTTVEEGLALVDETSRLFVSLVEHYVRALGEDQDPALAETWVERKVEPVPFDEDGRLGSDLTDTTPPGLAAFALEPPDGTPAEDPTVTVTCRIVDERSGIGDGGSSSPSQARLRSPSGQMRDVLFVPSTRVSGDERDGSYSSSFTLDGHAERGLWRVEYVALVDNAGNRRTYTSDTLAAQGFPAAIVVR